MKQRSFFDSLRFKITWPMLFMGLLPVLAVGIVAYISINGALNSTRTSVNDAYYELEENVIGVNVANAAMTTAIDIDQFTFTHVEEVQLWTFTPVVIETARMGYIQAEKLGLPEMSIDEIEELMASSGGLVSNPAIDNYLNSLLDNDEGHFGEIFFTDAHGYNVALTGPTSDFVQSDEQWWQTAWESGISIGEVEYDDSAQVWGCNICVRIDDPDTGEAVGVIKTVLTLGIIQEIASLNASLVTDGTISILTRKGLLIAETATGHDPERIMNADADVHIDVGMAVNSAFLSEDVKGSKLTEGIVLGYSRSSQEDYYRVLRGFGGFEWAVVVEQPKSVSFASLAGLNNIEDDLESSRGTIGVTVTGMAMFVSVIAVILALMLSRGIILPVLRLRDAAERISVGDLRVEMDISGDDELCEAGRSFSKVVDSLKEITEVCESVAGGDYNRFPELRGEDDRLGQALNQMMINLRETSADTLRKINYFNNIPVPVHVVDIEMDIQFINQAGLDLIGKTWADCVGMKCYDLMNTDQCNTDCQTRLAIRNGGIVTAECVAELSHGTVPIRYTSSALYDEKGVVIGAIESFNNISDEIGIVEMAERIAMGDYTSEVPSRFEGDRLSIALEEMLGGLKSTVEQANLIAVGDYSSVMSPRSEHDALAIAFQNMNNTLQGVTDMAAAISSGDYSRAVDIKSEEDLLGRSLNEMLINLNTLTEENEKQLWFAEGHSGFGEVMSGEQDVQSLADRIVTYLAERLGAQIATMYVLQGDNKLHLVGRYAFSCRGNQSMFAIGEGLVGQAAREGEMIVCSDIPEDYIWISSSLGEMVPLSIVVSPFLLSGGVKGVVELGSFEKLSQQKMKFLRESMDAVAIAVNSAQSRVLMNELLAESRELSYSLQSQREELEAANEELREKSASLEQQAIDISQKNSALEVLYMDIEQHAEDLARSSQYKSEFMANMSHELRTPLNSLLVLSQDLASNKRNNLMEDQIESADIIHRSGNDLLSLINEILDLAKIESGKMPVNVERVHISDVVEDIRISFGRTTAGMGLNLDITVSENMPETILTDQQRMNQVIKNLISNALKFTESGTVTVSFFKPVSGDTYLPSMQDSLQMVAISVVDTGIGIAPERQEDVFEAFQQADGGTSRQYGGTGLGLTISKEIAVLLGGDLVLESEAGRGSTFTFYLLSDLGKVEAIPDEMVQPLRASMPFLSQAQPEVSRSVQCIQDDQANISSGEQVVMIVDDDLSFAGILYNFCHEKGFKSIHAADGETAVRMAAEFIPIAIILDVHLPVMDGWGVLEALKDNPDTRHIPVHMISADAETMDAYRKGAMGYLSKPVSNEQLHEAFSRIGNVISRDVKNLLVIDDDENMRKRIIKLIGNGDVRVTEAGSGKEALEQIDGGTYDCVVLDLGLPDISGFEVLKGMESSGYDSIPPVIVYTGRDLTAEEKQQLQQYARSIIIKDAKSKERLLDETALFLHREISKLPASKKRMIAQLHDKDAVFKGKKVIIVDDDMRNVFALSKALEDRGLEILKASNGKRALEILEETCDIDLVLMDIMMPVMDGFEAIRCIREQERFSDIPVLALTAKAMAGDREECINAGANDYIPKPVDVDRLLSLMRVWLYK